MTFRKFIFLLKLLAKRDFEPSTTDRHKPPSNVHEIALPECNRLVTSCLRVVEEFFRMLVSRSTAPSVLDTVVKGELAAGTFVVWWPTAIIALSLLLCCLCSPL